MRLPKCAGILLLQIVLVWMMTIITTALLAFHCGCATPPPTDVALPRPEQSDAYDQFRVGFQLLQSHDYTGAFPPLLEAAEQGHARAQYLVGWMYAYGKGVTQDYAKAAGWYAHAGEQGNAHAQFNLGAMHEQGLGVPRDSHGAFKWYWKAAEQGHVSAQYHLGLLYGYGRGVVYDHVEAFNWLYKAARQGHVAAMYYVGSMYFHNAKTSAEYEAAFEWFTKAAGQGYEEAYSYLGDMYLNGQGTATNTTESYVWFKLASDHNSTYATDMQWVADYLSDAELSKADERYQKRKKVIALSQEATNARGEMNSVGMLPGSPIQQGQ